MEWTPLGLDIDGEAAGDNSGLSVSLSSDGTRVAIGAQFNGSTNAGHVRVYEFLNNAWVQLGLDIDGEAADDKSGYSVSLSSDGTTVAIGAIYNDGNGSNAGHVRVYKFLNRAWSKIGDDINGEASGDSSGWSVSLSADGSRVAIGALYNGAHSGHVRIYEWTGTAWSKIGDDIDGEAAGDNSGASVSLSADGSTVAIGAIGNDGTGANAGHVRIYEWTGTAWSKIGDDIDGEAANDYSSYSVSLSADGTRVAIGAIGNDGTGANNVGHVRIYKWNGTAWSKIGKDISGEAANDYSGYSVSLSYYGSRVAIGSIYNGSTDAGHVRIYEWTGTAWSKIGDDIDGEAANDESGWSVSLSYDGSTVAIGALYNDGTTDSINDSRGHVRVYQLVSTTTTTTTGAQDTTTTTTGAQDTTTTTTGAQDTTTTTTGAQETTTTTTGAQDTTTTTGAQDTTTTTTEAPTTTTTTTAEPTYKTELSLEQSGTSVNSAIGKTQFIWKLMATTTSL